MSKVSIIVVNWNGENLLNDCLGALFRQTYEDREIILVDNGSTDLSVQFAEENFPEIKIVKLPQNRGFTGGNLEGLKVAGGEFVALVNNDTRVDQKWLENLVQPMLNDARIGICASQLLLDKTGQINSAGICLTTSGIGFDRGYGEEASAYGSPEQVFGACAAAVLYRRAMVEEIGFLDDDFFLYSEDLDLSFRAQLAGWKCMYVPTAVAYHKFQATTGRLSDIHVYYHNRNLEFVWIKDMPLALMLRFAPQKLIQEVGDFCSYCIGLRKWVPFFRAKRDALRMLPGMIKKRRVIQKKKKASVNYIREILTPIFGEEMKRHQKHSSLAAYQPKGS